MWESKSSLGLAFIFTLKPGDEFCAEAALMYLHAMQREAHMWPINITQFNCKFHTSPWHLVRRPCIAKVSENIWLELLLHYVEIGWVIKAYLTIHIQEPENCHVGTFVISETAILYAMTDLLRFYVVFLSCLKAGWMSNSTVGEQTKLTVK